MKILKPKNILSIIYCILLSAPIFSVAIRCAYVVCNKNAYQSYSGTNKNQVDYIDVEELESNETYLFTSVNGYTQFVSSGMDINMDMIEVVSSTGVTDENVENIKNATNLLINYGASTYLRFDNNGTYSYVDFSSQAISFKFIYINGTNIQSTALPLFKQVVYNYETYLDNVFDYSVNKFIEDNNIGQIDLTSWFTNLFLSNQSVNVQYINFLNWYLNYALLVSCVNILFLVLMWFVNFARRLLEKSMNAGYDW